METQKNSGPPAPAQPGGPPVPARERQTVKALLRSESYQSAFRRVLKDRAEQFMSAVVQLSQENNLRDCEPNSLIAACMIPAALDLPIDKSLGFAHIVPYVVRGVKRAQFQMGYKGFIQLASRPGILTGMNAKAINAEAFAGYDDIGDPKIDWAKLDETKDPVGFCFAFRTSGGFRKVVYWPKDRALAHAKRYSKSYQYAESSGKKDSIWHTNFPAMALKTAIKDGLSHWALLSIEYSKTTEIREAMAKDHAVVDTDGALPKLEFPERDPEDGPVTTEEGAMAAESAKPANLVNLARNLPKAEPPPIGKAEAQQAAQQSPPTPPPTPTPEEAETMPPMPPNIKPASEAQQEEFEKANDTPQRNLAFVFGWVTDAENNLVPPPEGNAYVRWDSYKEFMAATGRAVITVAGWDQLPAELCSSMTPKEMARIKTIYAAT